LLPGFDILLIDESARDADILTAVLDQLFPQVGAYWAQSAEEGLAFLKWQAKFSGPKRLRLIVLDINVDLNMPAPRAFDTLRSIRSDTPAGLVPIVVFCGSEAEVDVNAAYLEGANACIRKSGSPQLLSEQVRTLIGHWLIHAESPSAEPHSV